MLLLSSVLISSCSDDEQMTTDHSAQLSFSQDTVSFDTIFSGITSPTERVRVYNKNDKGLRIKNVRLESGGTSGFMMNVDGQNGTSINDVQGKWSAAEGGVGGFRTEHEATDRKSAGRRHGHECR